MNLFKKTEPPPKENNGFFIILIMLFIIIIINKNKKEKKDEKENKKTNVNNLNNIIGLESVKEEINYYMDFIKNKELYREWGVKLPKGVLLAGPPGTGKTLLVKTMSKELDIPLITASGSEFIEMYVGVGAKRVRDLFKKAKQKESCIIFIDEIDAVGRNRDIDNNSERASTVNQLLTEMDGFDETNNIMVFAATNLIKFLDPALTRSGRFDKKVYFDLPNIHERAEMYKLYLKNMRLPRNLSFKTLSERTAGVSGADIANISNQAKINAIQNNNRENTLKEKDIQKAIDEIMIGREKRERILSKDELTRVSYHEAGHCLIGFMMKYTEPPIKVSIIPRGEAALGFSQQKPQNKKLMIKQEVLSRIAVLLAGRCAEKLIYNNVSTGASDDIEKVSNLLYNYTVYWGMNNHMGPINIDVMGSIGKSLSNELMNKCKNIIIDIENQTLQILLNNKNYLLKIANSLLKNETIVYKEIIRILPNKIKNSTKINIDSKIE